jgi:SAM-dependent methyltransferase
MLSNEKEVDMAEYTDSTYGELIADQYDTLYSDIDPNLVDRLLELSSGGKTLELGIGTGRIAIPLSNRGVEIHGIDASQAMLEKLRSKGKGRSIPVKMCSFAEFDMEEKYEFIFIVFNTFFGLLTQKEQISCFKSVSKSLRPGGKFLIEAFVPDLSRFDKGQAIRTSHVSTDGVRLECSQHDLATQTVVSQLVMIGKPGVNLYPVNIRYAWPSELDLMAELANLRLTERWGGWDKQPFTSSSTFHISIYEK